eukprot:gnl/MRDRNA2_/MRDRNA2_190683_c0_seq1.p1 gnl/MRDRNA2_/MRDRNA2_190683_c0~~gnl/MRDRNA2_/MRDRNA2_190683_c0_seq1.p1  ORF type:complete len:230 (+),score=60.21 gnl/MRDRNA2_/MRDRNA2_190683_c0_seq1:55-744(+)
MRSVTVVIFVAGAAGAHGMTAPRRLCQGDDDLEPNRHKQAAEDWTALAHSARSTSELDTLVQKARFEWILKKANFEEATLYEIGDADFAAAGREAWEKATSLLERAAQNGGATTEAAKAVARAARVEAHGDVAVESDEIAASWTAAESAWEALAAELAGQDAVAAAAEQGSTKSPDFSEQKFLCVNPAFATVLYGLFLGSGIVTAMLHFHWAISSKEREPLLLYIGSSQ